MLLHNINLVDVYLSFFRHDSRDLCAGWYAVVVIQYNRRRRHVIQQQCPSPGRSVQPAIRPIAQQWLQAW